MNKLDDLSYIKKLDRNNGLSSIQNLSQQCKQVFGQSQKFSFPPSYKQATSLLFVAMGGSAYAARIMKSLYRYHLPIPIDLVSDYQLPSYVDTQDPLIIAASYSGSTEETMYCAKEAVKKKKKIIGISSGGKLASFLQKEGQPMFVFQPIYNPSRQPRLGQGYMQIGQIALLSLAGFLPDIKDEINNLIEQLEKNRKNLDPWVTTSQNEAKNLCLKMEDKIVNIIGAQFLEGAVHAIRNPFHETGKHFANHFIVPELNHHLMEGLLFPTSLKSNSVFLLVQSDLYSDVIKRRMRLTKEIIEKNSIPTIEIHLHSPTQLTQVFELIQLGSYITFYLAIAHGINPAQIPWVDYFKKKLGKGEQYEK